jgi:xylulokinase
VIEGVSFALADSAILMREIGVSLETVRATGGGAKSPLWRSVLASLLGARVLTAPTDAGPAFGAAILAGVGAGRWVSVAEAGEALVDITGETLPNPELEQIYAGYHRLYDALYPSLAGRFAELARLREELG